MGLFSFGGNRSFSSVHPKSIYDYTDVELQRTFGIEWMTARRMIDEHTDDEWSNVRQYWRGQPATENQQMMLMSAGYPTDKYDKHDSSIIIDYIMFKARFKAQVEYEKKKAIKDAQKQAEREEKQRIREEAKEKRLYERKAKNSADIEKVRKSFERLWNKMLEDDKFSEGEILKLRDWCKTHVHLNDDFSDMIALCDRVIEDHVVDLEENGLLYDEAIKMIERMIPVE